MQINLFYILFSKWNIEINQSIIQQSKGNYTIIFNLKSSTPSSKIQPYPLFNRIFLEASCSKKWKIYNMLDPTTWLGKNKLKPITKEIRRRNKPLSELIQQSPIPNNQILFDLRTQITTCTSQRKIYQTPSTKPVTMI